MKKWDYKVITWGSSLDREHEETLNTVLFEVGEEGWELTSVVPQSIQVGTVENIFIFKRPLE